MSRYIKGDKVRFLDNDTIYLVKKVEVLPKLTVYLLRDENGNEKECYQAKQIRKIKDNFCKYFEEYHSEKRCKCVDDLTDCNGNEKKCKYPIGRKSYEEN